MKVDYYSFCCFKSSSIPEVFLLLTASKGIIDISSGIIAQIL